MSTPGSPKTRVWTTAEDDPFGRDTASFTELTSWQHEEASPSFGLWAADGTRRLEWEDTSESISLGESRPYPRTLQGLEVPGRKVETMNDLVETGSPVVPIIKLSVSGLFHCFFAMWLCQARPVGDCKSQGRTGILFFLFAVPGSIASAHTPHSSGHGTFLSLSCSQKQPFIPSQKDSTRKQGPLLRALSP